MKYEIQTPGEKIKKIKKQLGLTQDELVINSKFTRQSVSLVENGKKLSAELAAVLVNNINRVIKEKGVAMDLISIDYLTESLEKQLDRIASEYIKELDDFSTTNTGSKFIDLKKEIDEFMEERDSNLFAERKYTLNYLMALNLLKRFQYDEAYLYTFEAYELALYLKDANKQIRVIALIINIYYRLNRMVEILSIGKRALNISLENNIKDTESLATIYYNLALAYKKNNNYTECLRMLEVELLMTELKPKDRIKAKILKGNCYQILKQYDAAEHIYTRTLDEAKSMDDSIYVAMSYYNLALISLERKDLNKTLYYADLLVMMNTYNEEQDATNLYWATYLYKEIDNYKSVIRYYKRALKALAKIKNIHGYYDLSADLIAYFTKFKYKLDVIELVGIVAEGIKEISGNYKSMILGSLYKAVCYINTVCDSSTSKEIYEKVLALDNLNN